MNALDTNVLIYEYKNAVHDLLFLWALPPWPSPAQRQDCWEVGATKTGGDRSPRPRPFLMRQQHVVGRHLDTLRRQTGGANVGQGRTESFLQGIRLAVEVNLRNASNGGQGTVVADPVKFIGFRVGRVSRQNQRKFVGLHGLVLASYE